MHMKTKPIEILLVEDNEDDVLIIQEALAEAKLLNLVKVASDGEEALEYLRQENNQDADLPGLVLLDINMPRKNGFEVLETVKADPGLQHIPVIMLTVSDRDTDIVKSYAKGASSFLKKPVSFDELREVVNCFELYWTLVSKLPHTGR